MTILLLVMTDGRADLIKQTIPSALTMFDGDIAHRVIHDDSGSPEYKDWLQTNFPTFDVIGRNRRVGFGGAIKYAWETILAHYDFDYTFHLEDDFTFNDFVFLNDMIEVLDSHPHLLQMALMRQPWNQKEIEAGGVMQSDPEAFTPQSCRQHHWVEQRKFFTTNPSLYPRSLVLRGWSDEPHSEGILTHSLLNNIPLAAFGYWGKKFDPPRVTHIGNQRIGIGY